MEQYRHRRKDALYNNGCCSYVAGYLRRFVKTPFAKYFKGQSYLAPVSKEQVFIANVTFEPKCRNNWHIHNATKGGGQILVCVGGEGYYQEWGKPAIKMKEGDVVNIPVGVKHWHGAGKEKWFSHLAIEVPAENGKTEWREPVFNKE